MSGGSPNYVRENTKQEIDVHHNMNQAHITDLHMNSESESSVFCKISTPTWVLMRTSTRVTQFATRAQDRNIIFSIWSKTRRTCFRILPCRCRTATAHQSPSESHIWYYQRHNAYACKSYLEHTPAVAWWFCLGPQRRSENVHSTTRLQNCRRRIPEIKGHKEYIFA